jgi:DNA-directed RNA polymerase specialized sigma24 family protein
MRDNSEDSLEKIPDKNIGILSGLVMKESYKVMKYAIMSLPDNLRNVAYLSIVYEHSHDEISKILKISYDSSKTKLYRAKMKIRKILAGDGNVE